MSKENFYTKQLPDQYILVAVLIIGVIFFPALMLTNNFSSQPGSFVPSFYPLTIISIYIWIKSLVTDYLRIKQSRPTTGGTIYFAFILVWFTQFLLSSYVSDTQNGSGYFSEKSGLILAVTLFILDIISSYPFNRIREILWQENVKESNDNFYLLEAIKSGIITTIGILLLSYII